MDNDASPSSSIGQSIDQIDDDLEECHSSTGKRIVPANQFTRTTELSTITSKLVGSSSETRLYRIIFMIKSNFRLISRTTLTP